MKSGLVRRSRIAAAVLGVLTTLGFVGLSAVVPGTAAARCAGSVEVRNNLVIDQSGQKEEVVAERPINATCNGNNIYQGLMDSKWAGWRPTVWISENPGGPWIAYRGTYDNISKSYTHHDLDKNSQFQMILCIDKDGLNICGMGEDWGWSDDGTIYNGAIAISHGF